MNAYFKKGRAFVMNILTGLIKCNLCGKNFNYKPNNGQHEYVCQTRKNKGLKSCVSPVVKENYLLDIIETHCKHQGKDYAASKVKLFVKEIKIDTEKIKILYKDGTISEITQNQILF
jgi:hypothetical protein